MNTHPASNPTDPENIVREYLTNLWSLYAEISKENQDLKQYVQELEQQQTPFHVQDEPLIALKTELEQAKTELENTKAALKTAQANLEDTKADLKDTNADLKTAQAKVIELNNQLHQERTKLENLSQQQTPPTKVINGVILPHGHDTSINAHKQSSQRTHATQTHQNPTMAKRAQTPDTFPPVAKPTATAYSSFQPPPIWQQISHLYHKGHEEALLQLNVLKVGVDETTQRERRSNPELPVILTPNQSSQYHYLVLGRQDPFIAVPKMGLVIQAKLVSMIALKDLYEVSGESGRIRSIEAPALLSKQDNHFRILQKGHLTLGS